MEIGIKHSEDVSMNSAQQLDGSGVGGLTIGSVSNLSSNHLDVSHFGSLQGLSYGSTYNTRPVYRTKDVENTIEISSDVPGIKTVDIEIEFVGDCLKVSGKRYDTNESIGFTFGLAGQFKVKSAKATVEDGVLTITMQRIEKSYHKIEAKSAK